MKKKTSNKTQKTDNINSFLPEWDLSKFYNGIDDPEIVKDKKELSELVDELIDEKDFIVKMKDFEILTFIRKYEAIIEMVRNLSNFASLNATVQRNNKEAQLFEKRTEEFLEKILERLVWIHNCLYEIPLENKIQFWESQKLKKYQDWLMYQLFLPPTFSSAISKAINKMMALTNGWPSLYKELTSKLNFVIDNKKYTLDEISEIAVNSKDKALRDQAQNCLSEEFNRHDYIFAQTLNSIYKSEDTITKVYLNGNVDGEVSLDALDMDGFSNGLGREDVLAIATAVCDSYIPISQRFYSLLAKLQGKDQLDYNDRIQNPIEVEHKKIPWIECVEFVLNTIGNFNTLMLGTGIDIVNGQYIHAKPLEGKDAGAFCIRGQHPYIFLNYRENQSSVLTFAHEFGHAIHHVFSHEVGPLNDSTPISMSEVASIFNEKLIFNSWISRPDLSNKEKLYLLIENVNRQIADIHRQIAFSKFELRAFRERQSGELSTERFTQIYCEEMKRYLGFPLNDNAKFSWMAIPHIFNSPFYVRYYAFAGLVVNKLWQVYTSGKIEDFADRYIDMLSNTGIEDIDSLLEPFDLNIMMPDFWSSALDPISAEIDEIESLAKAEGLL